jgi:hypothetical protein
MATKTKTEKKTEKKTDGAEKKTRVKRPKLDAMIASLARAAKTEERIQKAKASADKVIAKSRAALVAWNKVPHDQAITTAEIVAHFDALKSENFEAPKTRITVEPISTGTAVEILPDFLPTYQLVYTPEELNSMVYDFLDEVNKTGMCKSDSGRYVAVKFKHIRAKSDAGEASDVKPDDVADDVTI